MFKCFSCGKETNEASYSCCTIKNIGLIQFCCKDCDGVFKESQVANINDIKIFKIKQVLANYFATDNLSDMETLYVIDEIADEEDPAKLNLVVDYENIDLGDDYEEEEADLEELAKGLDVC